MSGVLIEDELGGDENAVQHYECQTQAALSENHELIPNLRSDIREYTGRLWKHRLPPVTGWEKPELDPEYVRYEAWIRRLDRLVFRLATETVPRDLKRFQACLKEWLVRNELTYDLNFWSQDEWRARKGEYLDGAEFVITSGGELSLLLNFHYDSPKVEELEELGEAFGYYFEMGHAWSIGYYPLEGYQGPAARGLSYADKLKDPRWIKKAAAVKERADYRCEDCGLKDHRVEAHHCWYRPGVDPWQYPLDAFRCLCRQCHESRKPTEERFQGSIARLKAQEVATIRESMENLFHWYDRKAALAFLKSIGAHHDAMKAAFATLLDKMTEPGAS